MEKVYVIGHKRPDTDSIASSISYAYLKNSIDSKVEYRPVKLGSLNPETEFVLSYFGVEEPHTIEHVHITVEDAMTKKVVTAKKNWTIHDVGNIMKSYSIRSIPVVDEEGNFMGLVTERKIARFFLGEFTSKTMESLPSKLGDVARITEGRIICGSEDHVITGRTVVGVMSVELLERSMKPGDVLIVGDRTDVQMLGIEKDVNCLIVTGGIEPEDEVVKRACIKGIPIILTPHDAYTAEGLLRLSMPVEMVMHTRPLITSPETLLRDFEEDLMESKDGVAVVLKDRKVAGIITRYDLINPRKKKVILVDHSERSISVEGIEEAEIVEIVDHHRLGGLETAHPLRVKISPVGSTSTLVWEEFKHARLDPPREIAGLMFSAILSDTLILRSPTTTRFDREAVEELSKILRLDPMEFGLEMFRHKMDFKRRSIEEIITMDLKELHTSRGTIAVAQVETIDPDLILSQKEDVLKVMKRVAEDNGYQLYVLMVTDVVKESSTLLCVGNTKILERAFNKNLKDGTLHLEGVVSRKKQVIPRIVESL